MTATARNQDRVARQNDADLELLCKYKHLPAEISDVFGPILSLGDDDHHIPDDFFLQAIEEVAETPQHPRLAAPFRFVPNQESVNHNTKLLDRYENDFDPLLADFQHTSLNYGEEFRPLSDLQKLYAKHKLFDFFKTVYQHGMDYLFTCELTENERMGELCEQLKEGNHQGASQEPEKLKEKLHRDVR